MDIFQLFNELDQVIMLHFGDVEAAFQTDRGMDIVKRLLSEENRTQLREWYRPRPRGLNSGAMEIKQRLERELGEEL